MKYDAIFHYRVNEEMTNSCYAIYMSRGTKHSHSRAGLTLSFLLDGEKILLGYSNCHELDKFSKKIGTQKARGMSRSKRAIVLKNYDYEDIKQLAEKISYKWFNCFINGTKFSLVSSQIKEIVNNEGEVELCVKK